jgi:hypothetical protein
MVMSLCIIVIALKGSFALRVVEVQAVEAWLSDWDSNTGNKSDTFPPCEQKSTEM